MKHTETGKVVYMTEPTNVSKKPEPFYKSELVIVQEGQYQKFIAFSVTNKNKGAIDAVKDLCDKGREVEVDFVVSSREYQGKYYTELRALNAKVADTQINSSPASPQQQPKPQQPQQQDIFEDNLPF